MFTDGAAFLLVTVYWPV